MFEFAMKTKTVVLRALVLAGVGLGMAAGAGASPVTFRFEAEITNIFNADIFDPGLDISLGDSIVGSFSFEPFAGDGRMSITTAHASDFNLSINGIAFISTGFDSRSINNSTFADFPLSLVDSIRISGTGLFPLPVDSTSTIDSGSSGFSIQLNGQATSLEQASLPSDPAIWNRFTATRRLSIGLDGVGLNGTGIGLQANISNFVVVPEPTSLSVALAVLVSFFATRVADMS